MGRHTRVVVVGGVALWVGLAGLRAGAADPSGPSQGPVAPPVPRDMLHVPSGRQLPRPPGQPRLSLPPTFPDRGIGPQGASNVDSGDHPADEVGTPYSTDPGVWDEKSWVCWWETNRDAVLKQVLKRRGDEAAEGKAAEPPPQRERAMAALVNATRAERPVLRAAAAIALGQARQADALPRLIEMTASDPEWYVRGMAWVGVGLVGADGAEAALLAARPRTEFEQLGVIAGLGLLDGPGERVFESLRAAVSNPRSPEVERMAMWALRVHHRAADHNLITGELAQSGGRQSVVSECLLALGAIGDTRDADLLADVASGGRASATTTPQNVVNGGGGSVQLNRGTYQYPQRQADPSQSTTLVYRGPDAGTLAAPRSSYARVAAALALGVAGDGRQPIAAGNATAQNMLIQNFAPYLDQGGPMWAGASIMSFAASMSSQDAYILHGILDMAVDPQLGMVSPKSPLRGYAALGLGVYLARGGTPNISTRPPGVIRVGLDRDLPASADVNETLAMRYMSQQESEELRAACALSLGLSGNPANVRRLLQGAEKIDRGNELLLGYTVLALGLLHERAALNAAGPLVSNGASRIDVDAVAARGVLQPWGGASGRSAAAGASTVPQGGPGMTAILGRRAALLGIAVLGDARAEPALAGAWGRDQATVQDVGRALAWCHAYKTADPLSALVERDQKGAVEAAVTLGWVFDPDRPSRLSKLVVGNNYHEPQVDWAEGLGTVWMVRNFVRVGDLYLYSTPLGGQPMAVHHAKPATRRATTP